MRTLLTATLFALALPLTAGAFAPVAGPFASPSVQATHVITASCNPACLFTPPVVVAAAGDTVVWNIVGTGCHTVTAGLLTETEPAEALAPPGAGLGGFDSGERCSGSFSHTFPAAGTVAYYCATTIHRFAGMHGEIVVT